MLGPEPHLTDKEIRNAIGGSTLPDHAEHCDMCREIITLQREIRETAGVSGVGEPGPNCVSDDEIGGLISGSVRDENLVLHVSECEWCGGRLTYRMRHQVPDSEILPKLASARPEWQDKLARSVVPKRRFSPWLFAIAAMIIATIGWSLLRRSTDVEAELARAYTQNRPFDYRLPDAGYASPPAQRGEASVGVPPALLRAELRLSEKKRLNARWWKLSGTAELLRLDPEQAVRSLKNAATQAPDDVDAATTLAIAYALLAEKTKKDEDWGESLNLLISTIKSHPNDKRLLFNLALVHEKLKNRKQAIQDWEKYLNIESDPKWVEEAKAHLNELKLHSSLRDGFRMETVADENSFLARTDPPHADDFLERTALLWLSHVVKNDSSRNAVSRLAELLVERHSDTWLKGALKEALRSKAIGDLLSVVDLNLRGEADAAMGQAAGLVSRLDAEKSSALAARARLELVYALHRSLHPSECIAEARQLENLLARDQYPWIQIQNRLEGAVCSSMMGREGDAIGEYGRLFHQAEDHRFLSLSMRALGLADDARTLAGDPLAAWGRIGLLNEYWQSGVSPVRGYQLFFNMANAASRLDLRFAAVDFARAAVTELAKVGNFSTEALANATAAGFAIKAGLPDEAALFFDRASAAQAKAFPSKTLNLYRLEADLARTQAELDRGQIVEARARLRALEATWNDSEQPFAVELRKNNLMGYAALRSGEFSAARDYLEAAVRATRTRVDSLHTSEEKARVLEAASEPVKTLMELSLAEGRAPEEALDLWLGFRSQMTADEVRGYQVRGECWLVFTEIHNRVAAWLKDGDAVAFQWLRPSPGELAGQTKLLLDLVSDPDSDIAAIQAVSTNLYRELITPFAARITTSLPLLIFADGGPAAVPFSLLESERGDTLGDSHPIVLSSRFSHDVLQVPFLSKSSVALAVSQSSAEILNSTMLPSLPQAGAEARAVAARFAGSSLLEDGDATLSRIQTMAPRIELFHFAGHGFSNLGNGSLVLDNATMSSKQIMASNWSSCRLAVLSACLTAAGESRGPVNPESLVRAFLISGVQAVIAAQWKIDSAATKDLMNAFYAPLLAGTSVPVALQQAQRVIRTAAAYRHPYYWGAFAVYQ